MNRAMVLAFAAAVIAPVAAAGAEPTSLAPVLRAPVWLQGRPTATALANKVVVVDVFTVDCINCKNVTPNLRALNERQRGRVAIIGIHTPETPYERNRSHVVESLRALGITWPVAVDDDASLWKAYRVEYWPTQLIFDRRGRLRKTVVGDSQDDVVNDAVRHLLAESSR